MENFERIKSFDIKLLKGIYYDDISTGESDLISRFELGDFLNITIIILFILDLYLNQLLLELLMDLGEFLDQIFSYGILGIFYS